MQTNNAHECYLARRHWPTRDPYMDMGHGWASDVALRNIHERCSLTSRFLLYKNTFEPHFKIRILVL